MHDTPEPAAEHTKEPITESVPGHAAETTSELAGEPDLEPVTEPRPTIVVEPDLELVIELVKQRINDHGPLLSQNRKRVELALVHPILAYMDWDADDLDLFVPEYYGKDSALVSNSTPIAILTVSALHRKSTGLDKKLEYCETNFIRYLIETNGNHWQMHSALSPQREFPKADLAQQPTHEAADILTSIFRTIDTIQQNFPHRRVPSNQQN